MTTYDLSGVKPSPPAEGLQKVIEKYTKLVMKKLYGEDVLVFFTPDVHWPNAALFRNDFMAPPYGGDIKIWLKDKKHSITFKELHYGKDRISPRAWNTIVHEVTHFEIPIGSKIDSDGYLELGHSKKFYEVHKQNLKKVDDLRKKFNKEVGWPEDYVFESKYSDDEGFMDGEEFKEKGFLDKME